MDWPLDGPEESLWLSRLEDEHDNVRDVFAWVEAQDEAEVGVRLAAAMWPLWYAHGYLHEGRARLERQLAAAPHDEDSFRARAIVLRAHGIMRAIAGDFDRASASMRESLVLSQRLGDRKVAAAALNALGLVAARRDDPSRAESLIEAALRLARESGDARAIAMFLSNLSTVARARGHRERAIARAVEQIAVLQTIPGSGGLYLALETVAYAALDDGADVLAGFMLREVLSLRTSGISRTEEGIEALEGLAVVAARGKRPTHAARLIGAAMAMRAKLGAPVPPSGWARLHNALTRARTDLGAEAFGEAFASGRLLSIEDAIAEALDASASASS